MKALKKKEAEETKALEEMVLKVETNLKATTVSQNTRNVMQLLCGKAREGYREYVSVEKEGEKRERGR